MMKVGRFGLLAWGVPLGFVLQPVVWPNGLRIELSVNGLSVYSIRDAFIRREQVPAYAGASVRLWGRWRLYVGVWWPARRREVGFVEGTFSVVVVPVPEIVGDNAVEALMEFVRADDRAGFDALAACLMPKEQVEPCWRGARARLGLAP